MLRSDPELTRLAQLRCRHGTGQAHRPEVICGADFLPSPGGEDVNRLYLACNV
jgi:hypothetical protein